jgi:hypothetical protein
LRFHFLSSPAFFRRQSAFAISSYKMSHLRLAELRFSLIFHY